MNLPLSHIAAFLLLFVAPALDPLFTRYLKQSKSLYRRLWWYGVGMSTTGLFALYAIFISPTDWTVSPVRASSPWGVSAAALLTVASLYLLGKPVVKVCRKPELRAKTHKQFASMEFVLPQSLTERRVFIAVCLMAGFGEELVFRGFLTRYFMNSPYFLPGFVAAVVSAAGFGMNHLYQGWKGVLSTAIIGFGFFAIAYGFGSLIPGMIVHALMDLRVLAFTLPEGHPLLSSD